ncbi:hypothetical protein BC833DRAFT_592225 [Globomyces pollinis-pini]|nr:hypothetical protein BC833DRAFT_592225 [Globomyces pollinis-pini]
MESSNVKELNFEDFLISDQHSEPVINPPPIRKVCPFYQQGSCRKGIECAMSHQSETKSNGNIKPNNNRSGNSSQRPKKNGKTKVKNNICNYFKNYGSCSRNECTFSHDIASSSKSTNIPHISKNFVPQKIFADSFEEGNGSSSNDSNLFPGVKFKLDVLEDCFIRDFDIVTFLKNQTSQLEINPENKTNKPSKQNEVLRTPRNKAAATNIGKSSGNGLQNPTPKTKKLWESPRNTPSKKKKNFYKEYISEEEKDNGLEDKTILQGTLRISKANRNDGYVRSEGEDDDIFISGMKHMNRALDGDIVLVELLTGDDLEQEKNLQKEKKMTKSLENQKRQNKCNLTIDEVEVEEFEETRVFGTIVFILESSMRERTFVGELSVEKPTSEVQNNGTGSNSKFVWFKPSDKRVPFILLSKSLVPGNFLNDPDSFDGTLVTAKITNWRADSIFPIGEFVNVLGKMGHLTTESEALLVSSGITWEFFSDEVVDSLVPTPWSIPESEFANRRDMRLHRVFSIDPPTARDLDDALSCIDLGDGTFEIGVHIADVSYFVRNGTKVDDEAFNRATSVYLVQKVIPMLPRLLCEELCSLNGGVDRLAFSVFWIFDSEGNIVGEPTFQRTVINSCAKLSYDNAQAVIEGRDWDETENVELYGSWTIDQIRGDIQQLYKFSKVLRENRYKNGSLTLNSIKLWFDCDDTGLPVDSGVYLLKESNKLIEEYMLLANRTVAEKIVSYYPESSLLRRHTPPLMRSLNELAKELEKKKITLDTTSALTLNNSLNKISDPLKQSLVRLMCIKSMRRADYFCTGSVDISSFGHYALSIPLYTHFTSPIRRYCDLVVHQMLEACLADKPEVFTSERVDEIAKQCNNRKNAAKDAQDASQNLYLCTYLHGLQMQCADEGIYAKAYINGIESRAFDVLVPRFGIETRVWIEDSIDRGEVIGIESRMENCELVIHWKVPASVEVPDAIQPPSIKNGEEDNVSDPLEHVISHTQIIGLFDSVQVLITTDIERSPPTFKLYAVPPFLDKLGDTTSNISE